MRERTEMVAIFPVSGFMAGEVGFPFEGLLAVRAFAMKTTGVLIDMVPG